MPTVIKGQPTSAEIRQELKKLGMPVILMFSCGKDSVAAWIAMEEDGIEVIPVFLSPLPGAKFIEEELIYFENAFNTPIIDLIHPTIYDQLRTGVAQPPNRLGMIESIGFPKRDYDAFWDEVRKSIGVPHECYLADGVRANDSMVRRVSFTKHGVMRANKRKVSPIADWTTKEVYSAIERRGLELPIDYELFGRSFDGADYRFIKPLKEHLPEDYELLKRIYPLVETDIFRHECLGEHNA